MIRDPSYFTKGLSAFAKLAGRSPKHLSKELKRYTGLTPTNYINQARLEYASRRLRTSDLTVEHVARETGFRSVPHFYKLFERRFGKTPQQFRAEQHASVPTWIPK